MELFIVINTAVVIGYILMILSVIAINIVLWKGYLTGRKIKEKTYQLGKGLNDEKVKDYIKFIDNIEIPPRRYYWNMVQAGYEIVKINEDINLELVEQLKIVILSRGILV